MRHPQRDTNRALDDDNNYTCYMFVGWFNHNCTICMYTILYIDIIYIYNIHIYIYICIYIYYYVISTTICVFKARFVKIHVLFTRFCSSTIHVDNILNWSLVCTCLHYICTTACNEVYMHIYIYCIYICVCWSLIVIICIIDFE